MWGWAFGGAATAGVVGFVLAGGPTCHCGPCLGQADDRTVAPTAPPVVVRFDEPPLARRPAPRYAAAGDPF